MKEILIDGGAIFTSPDLHEALAGALAFPEHYGKNLDALYDCLTEAGKPVQIIVSYVAEMQDNLRRYADNLLNTLEAAEEKNPNISVIIEEIVDEL